MEMSCNRTPKSQTLNHQRQVVLVRHESGRVYAMKSLKKSEIVEKAQTENSISERHVLSDSHHPFMVRLHYAFQTPSRLYLVCFHK
jgi:serine/threonine protein kinase